MNGGATGTARNLSRRYSAKRSIKSARTSTTEAARHFSLRE
nr:MAG TPA: hypothetical protein [Caudoviricetes sp.]